jgi:hypothetical protein
MQYLLLAFAASLASFDVHAPVPLVPAVLIAIIALPTLNAISLTVANGAALLFPGWVRLGDGRAAGIEAMGQNVLAIFVSLVVTLVAMLVPIAVATMVAAALSTASSRPLDAWTFVPAAPIAALIAFGELWLVVKWLGRIFARTDLAQIEAPG